MIHRLLAHFWYPPRIVRADTIGGPVGRKGKAIVHQDEDEGLSFHLVISCEVEKLKNTGRSIMYTWLVYFVKETYNCRVKLERKLTCFHHMVPT